MSHGTPELTAPEVLCHAKDLLEEHLPLNADGYKCTTADVLLGVAATKSILEAVCGDLVGTSAPHTIRGYFNEQLCAEELPELEPQLNAALAAEVPCRVQRQAQEVAIDYHNRLGDNGRPMSLLKMSFVSWKEATCVARERSATRCSCRNCALSGKKSSNYDRQSPRRPRST